MSTVQEAVNQDRIARVKWLIRRAEEVRSILAEEYQVISKQGLRTPGYNYVEFQGLREDGAFFSDEDTDFPKTVTLPYELLIATDEQVRAGARKDVNDVLREEKDRLAKRAQDIDKKNKESLRLLLNEYGHPDSWSN